MWDDERPGKKWARKATLAGGWGAPAKNENKEKDQDLKKEVETSTIEQKLDTLITLLLELKNRSTS